MSLMMVGHCNHMINNIVFLVFWPTTAIEEKKWHLSFLRQQGFTIEIYDLTYLLNSKAIVRHPIEGALQDDYIYKIKTYQELEYKIRQSASTSVFIDYLVGFSDIDLKTEKVFRILNQYNAKYAYISSGALPLTSSTLKSNNKTRLFLGKMEKALNPQKLWCFISRKLILLLTRHTSLYPLPHKIFSGDSDVLYNYCLKHRIDRSYVVPIHSYDYDTYLYYMRGINFKAPEEDNTCVFLDEAATHHSDFAILNIRPIEGESYYASMNRVFDKIEKETGLRVLIAAHPRSNYENMPDVFNGREIIKGRTIELVAKSSLTITHASTSINFPILYNKPIIFTKTAGMNNDFSIFIDIMASSLGQEAVDIDNLSILDNISFSHVGISTEKYDEYTYKYIKSKNIEELTVWEIIASEFKSQNHDK